MGRLACEPVNHTSWVALVTPTDRPKSVRNSCLIGLFCGVVCVVICPFDISVGVGTFVIGLGQITSFLSFFENEECRVYEPFVVLFDYLALWGNFLCPGWMGFMFILMCTLISAHWLLAGTPSAFGPELAYRLRVAQPTLMDVTRYFWYTLYYYTCLCATFLSFLHYGWLLVLSLHKEDYLQICKCVSFWLHGFCG